jgi:hypothetical protein
MRATTLFDILLHQTVLISLAAGAPLGLVPSSR